MLQINRERVLYFPETWVQPHSPTAQNVVARLGFFMLWLRYVMFPTMKAAFTTTAGALYRETRPTAIGQSQVGGTRL
ncbi:MAG: hypothetical protein Nkreftii_000089 [Candidatus Nitrospira kreftii]|uniref:Transposase n=1 Tax=Candidatus Nitrospira kreftii TaxID=2652173 RepID=A0A7S8FAH8_9BACT|nr:MAG: hypothetical protein Nkreftii_000089 [Candidatus Nitrospira kreftii]